MTTVVMVVMAMLAGFCDNLKKNQKGPTFRTEPPSRVEFSNTAGVELRCGADGIPTPRVYWQSRDGTQVADFPGLRYQRSHKDGASTLVFPPFSRGEYRREVHDAVYQCAANNDVGAVLSRTVHVKAVVKQRFTPQVYDEFVARGNTAVLRCHLPSFAREHVVVDAWLRSDGQVLRIMEEQSRVAGRLSYAVLRSGELLIQDVQKEERDSGRNYRCQTRHKLTGEMVTSESSGKIIVTEPHASTLPSFTFSRSQVRVEENSVAELPCVAQGNPPPTYRWVKDVSGVLIPVKEEKGKIRTNKGMLSILRVQQSDAGQYQCIARNSIGERRTETSLVVTAPLTAVLRPSRLELNVGQEATFNCNVTGHPLRRVAWIRDRLNITPVDNRVRLLSKDVLHISAVRREDKGMYQCFVYSDEDTAQGTAELAISDAPPSMISMFADQDVEPGDRATMKCISSGNPLPVITWFVYDDPISRTSPRISSNDYVAEPEGHVVSHLNITEARTQDGGEYICKASNEVGYAFHRARLNVRGPVFLRLMRNTTAIGGRDLELRCPYGGYPIREIRWYKDEILLPIDMRQKVNSTGVLAIKNIQREADEGQYKCEVQHADGETISGSTYVTVFVSPVIESAHLRNEITVNKNARTKLMCIVNEGDPPLRFHWLKNGHPFLAHGDTTVQTFEDSSIVTFKKVSSADRGMYTCVVSNVASSTNLTTQLIVNVPPQWTVEPQNTTAILAGKVWIDCAAVGFPAPNILWKKFVRSEKAGDDFAWVHSSPRAHRFQNGTLTLTDIEEEDAGSYLCQAHNGIGAGLSKIISLQVLVPPRFKDTFQSKVVAEGNDTVLKCIAYGDPPIDISWQKDEIELDVKRHTRYSIQKSSKQHETSSELIIKNASRDEDTGTFTCTAASNIGEDEAQRHLLVQGIPDPPANITVVEVTSRSVSLRWEVPHDGNSHRTGSVVQYKTDPDGLWTGSQVSQLIVSGSDTSATLRALSPVTTYLVRIVAENALGKSTPSDITNVTTSEEAPSGAPRDVQVQSTGAQSMKVSWKPPPEDTRNGRIRGYYVGYRQTGTSEPYHFQKVETIPDEDQRQSTYITGLKAFTEYDIAVRAFTSAGTGPKSSRVMGKTLETAPPTSPILQIGSSSSSTIDVSWEKDNRDRSAITEYTMHYKADGEEEWRKQKLGGNVDTYTLRGLKCGTRYNLYVTASNSLGTGEPSEPVTGRTKGAAPMSPKMEAFLTPNSTSAILHLDAWRSMGCPVDSFSIQFRPKLRPDSWSSVKTETADSSKTVHVLGPLSPGREYVVLITAHSEAGATQGEYHFKTLSLQASSGHSSNPAYGVSEDKPFYRNVALVIPVVVSSLVLVIVVFAVAVCLRKQSQDRREWLNEYGNHRKGGSDSLMMNEIGNSKKGNYSLPSEKSSHYAIPAASTKKTDYAEPYACDIASRQGSDGLFATIKRGPTRPLHVTAQHKADGST